MVAKKASNLITGASGGPNVSEDWTRFGKKRILSIGKKNQRIHDEDDEIADDAVGGHGYNSSSDEEEGRTSAVKEKTRKARPSGTTSAIAAGANEGASAVVALEPGPPKKKKKKGKKERAKMKNAEEAESTMKDIVTADDAVKDVKDDDDPVKIGGTTKNDTDPKKGNTKNTHRRKKVRSRQKNIRKDNRSANDRPSHLVLGNSEFSGRPLTDSTRKKLGFDEETAKDAASSAADVAFDSGKWVGGDDAAGAADEGGENGDGREDAGEGVSKPTKPKSEEDGDKVALTKIGDCIVGSDTAQSDDANGLNDLGDCIVSENKDKKKKKKQKRKFKNLVVG